MNKVAGSQTPRGARQRAATAPSRPRASTSDVAPATPLPATCALRVLTPARSLRLRQHSSTGAAPRRDPHRLSYFGCVLPPMPPRAACAGQCHRPRHRATPTISGGKPTSSACRRHMHGSGGQGEHGGHGCGQSGQSGAREPGRTLAATPARGDGGSSSAPVSSTVPRSVRAAAILFATHARRTALQR